ncbi:Y-family DNA polymerase [Mucilaginibacter myungsuensis]|uniref:Y-family DNA polymerase n=1 Tax=Mucilaginibacter myungsuensis TaxID=649104 RepID=A0A929PXV2_9SPHI|nr:Y-family DNA polymerase [Mucilaginibacter myungsuensis]MBE9662662.1 Y-family DNA polymerase [Mucilaginibacter myungsuensis]MDN3598082.1 Y-family DNA polymerase [Mucilaginibacter myungsuensis]
MFAHVDINNCYVSCERLFRPEFEGRVVVVLSNNDGCVIARSNEAKAIGIKMADAEFMVRERLEESNAVIFSSNYALYADMSARLMNNLARYTPTLMVYSIDEAFMAMGGLIEMGLDRYTAMISHNVMRDTGLPITIGVGPTMALAKLANKAAKKKKRGYLVLDDTKKIDEVMVDFPIEDVWGIGHAYYHKLTEFGITTAQQFRELRPDFVRQHMTIQGWRLHQELWGIPCNVVRDVAERSKGIESSQSFNTYQTELEKVEEAVAMHASTVALKLRQQKSMALNLTIYLRTNKHNVKHDQYYPSITVKVPFAANSTHELTRVCVQALRAIWQPGYNYLKTGVRATGIIPAGEVQYNMFVGHENSRQQNLSELMDSLNDRYGRGTLRLAAEGFDKTWKMKQDYLSKQYTTNWREIVVTK